MASPIAIKRFFTDFKQDRSDASKLIPVDKVEYGPTGGLQRSAVVSEISRLKNLQPLSGDSGNPAIEMAHMRWNAIRPHYEAWKSGQEMPLDGTPLAAWNALQAEQAEVLRSRGVKTIEDVASLTDSMIEGIPVPRLRDMRRQAAAFLESSDATRAAAMMAEKDAQIANAQSQIAEQGDQIKALIDKVNQLAEIAAGNGADDDEQPATPRRGPGRPPKQAAV